MNYRYSIANPAGNITILVATAVPKENHADVAVALLQAIDGAEQVGFVTAPRDGGDIRLEMMGGEFCGNALRSVGYYYAAENHFKKAEVKVEISGSKKILTVTADTEKGVSEGEFPLPQAVQEEIIDGYRAKGFFSAGILHYIIENHAAALEEAAVKAFLKEKTTDFSCAATGLMQLKTPAGELTPAVYVCATDTLYFESSCASGSAATAAFLSATRPDGIYLDTLQQPGGTLTVKTTKENNALTALKIGGKLQLSPEQNIEI